MFPRLIILPLALILLTANAHGLTDLRGVRMELPNLFDEWTPRQIVENVASANLNAILCTVHPSILQDQRFAEMLKSAHARGISVHVVISTIVADAITAAPPQPDPASNAVDSSGRLVAEWLCPAKPVVRQWVLDFARQLAALEIDGLQLDYIRFGPPDLCHCGVCSRESRRWLQQHSGKSREDWRESVITSLAEDVRRAVKGIRPGILFSCSTWTVGEGQRRTHLTPEGEGYAWKQGQDFASLCDRVDFLRPMLYACMLGKDSKWIVEMTRLAVKNAAGRTAIIPGIALSIEEPWKKCQMPPGELGRIIPKLLDAGAAGVAIFSYQSLFSPRYSSSDYLEEVRRAFSRRITVNRE